MPVYRPRRYLKLINVIFSKEPVGPKRCPSCKMYLLLEDFSKRDTYCKVCRTERSKQWYKQYKIKNGSKSGKGTRTQEMNATHAAYMRHRARKTAAYKGTILSKSGRVGNTSGGGNADIPSPS